MAFQKPLTILELLAVLQTFFEAYPSYRAETAFHNALSVRETRYEERRAQAAVAVLTTPWPAVQHSMLR